MSKERYFSTIEEFNKQIKAKHLMLNSLKELLPIEGNKFGFYFSIIVGFLLSCIIGKSENTILLLAQVSDKLLQTLLTIFGCVFAVYSILLAFLNDSYIKRLCKTNYDKNSSYLKKSTSYYESVLFLYFIAIGVNGILLLFLICIKPNFILLNNHLMNNMLAVILIWVYLGFTIRVLYELKSTIYNTIVLFRASIAYKLIDFAKDDNEK
ncbi:MAG: hypothetical protein AB9856_03575 [Cellulosilyticaceae bacterium]